MKSEVSTSTRLTRASSRIKKAGLPPGSLIYVGEKKVDQVRISFLDYDASQVKEEENASVEACLPLKETPTVSWINVDGLHDVTVVDALGSHFGIHPLMLEDILNPNQRPKVDDVENCLLIVLRMFRQSESPARIMSEQVSFVLGSNFVISFQEEVGDVFDPIRARLFENKGKIRQRGADYLLYSLLDAVVDSYFSVLEDLGDRIGSLEDELITDPTETTLHRIYALKREMVSLRRSIWPLRELTATLDRAESELITETTGPYLRDVHDHTIQVIDMVEAYRDVVSGMLDLYLSSVSHRMNQVMQILTITATIFIPLTFVAGVYGMNFENMPELHWRHGYFAIWGLMIALGVGMVVFFKRKKWL